MDEAMRIERTGIHQEKRLGITAQIAPFLD